MKCATHRKGKTKKTCMEHRESMWHYTFYFSLGVLAVWTILKVVGVINSPAWLETGIPAAGVILAGLSMYQNLLDKMHGNEFKILAVKLQLERLSLDHVKLRNYCQKGFSSLKR